MLDATTTRSDETATPASGPLRSAVVGFDNHGDRVPHEIHALEASGLVDVKLHFAIEGRVAFPNAETEHFAFYYEADAFTAPPAPGPLLEQIESTLPEFLVHQARVRLDQTQASFRLQAATLHSDTNLFYRLAGYLHEKLTLHDVELVLFEEIPHYGFDYLLYEVARALGIRTILFLQNIHTERTLVAERIEDFGRLQGGPVLSEPLSISVASAATKPLYVKVERHRDAVAEQLSAMQARQVRPKTLFWLPVVWLAYAAQWLASKVSGGRLRLRGDRLNAKLHDAYMGPELRKLQAREAFEGRARLATKRPALDADFVLFSLHMQPEVTTHPLGGRYGDQLRAVERLREMLPDDVRIYAKEHPHCFGALRDPHFHRRLAEIPGVELVSAEVESLPLLERCRFAATVTGTTGWEAITLGKPVLTFGHAWYNGLPGVFRYDDAPTFEKIVGCEIDAVDVERRFAELSTRFGGFTPAWGLESDQLPEGFDRAENGRRFVAGMQKLLASTG